MEQWITSMGYMESLLTRFADWFWGDWLLYALVSLGLTYTVMTGCIQVRFLKYIPKGLFKQALKKSGTGVSSWQSLCASLASCVGSGNIVGVSTALLAGGDGALFWMWGAAFLGMATKFGEIVMGVKYREIQPDGTILGGSMYYIAKRLGWRRVGCAVAIFLFIQNCGATLIQSNTMAQVLKESLGVSPGWIALPLAFIMYSIIRGGFGRIVAVAQRAVPFMASLYLLGGASVVIANISHVPSVIQQIVAHAFTLQAGLGGVAGYTMKEAMRYGVARGLYSNEAGEGTAPVLHAAAQVDHPVRQGVYGILEVLVDTFLICSTTGIVVLLTGVMDGHTNAATLAAVAFDSFVPGLRYLMYISLLLFAGTSIMNQWYFGYVSLSFLGKENLDAVYRYLFIVLIIVGSLGTIRLVWAVQDIALGFLVVPNIVAMFVLSPEVRQLTKEFFNPDNGYIRD